MTGSQPEETHQPKIVDQEQPKTVETEHQPQPQPEPSSSSPDQKKWGTHVMGAPAAPVAHPDNQQAAAWVAGDNQQTQYQPYVIYSPVENHNNNPLEPVIGMFHTWSRKAETVARNLWHNRKSPSTYLEHLDAVIVMNFDEICGFLLNWSIWTKQV